MRIASGCGAILLARIYAVEFISFVFCSPQKYFAGGKKAGSFSRWKWQVIAGHGFIFAVIFSGGEERK